MKGPGSVPERRWVGWLTIVGVLSFDRERKVRDFECAECGSRYRRMYRFVLRNQVAYGVCYASLHKHAGEAVAWLDVILGTWGENETADHVTFGCRVGPIEGQEFPAASLVPAAQPFAYRPIFGQRLSPIPPMRPRRLSRTWPTWGVIEARS